MIAGWTTVLNQGIHGGNPPNLDDVTTERMKLDEFARQLIGRHHYIEKEVRDLIVANTLRHWDETIELIQSEPNGKFAGEKMNIHPFVHNMYMALAYANVNKDTFKILSKKLDMHLFKRMQYQ